MEEGYISPSTGYRFDLLNEWREIFALGVKFRQNYLSGDPDVDVRNEYVARLTRMWGDLYPEIEEREDFGKFVEQYEEYEEYYLDPEALCKEATKKPEVMFKLEATIRRAIRLLKLTDLGEKS